jgi:hypothetical protein
VCVIAFQDFVPQLQRKRMLGLANEYESIREVVTRANRWIEREGVRVINVETLLLPTVPEAEKEIPPRMDSADVTFSSFQVVRVWYIDDASVDREYTGATRRLAAYDPEAERAADE